MIELAPIIALLPATTYRAMPWRNGLGTTTEIALEPGDDDRFHWRLSIADVAQSGPFSRFDDYDRIIAVVAGAGMRLAVDGRPAVLLDQASAPYGFAGDAATDCTLLDGPIRDFNLIFDRGKVRGAVVAMRPETPQSHAIDGGIILLYALAGALTVEVGSQGIWQVPEGDTLRLDHISGHITVAGTAGSRALLATVQSLAMK